MKKHYRLPSVILLLIPIIVYLISYIYLSIYHRNINLLSTAIHEGGLYNFIETLLYASHFLGHIPVHLSLALYFVGVYKCMSEIRYEVIPLRNLYISLIFFFILLILSWQISVKWFGIENTLDYIFQNKQSVITYEEGGSWNLHLPSTLMQLFLIPVYIFVIKKLLGSKLTYSYDGVSLILFSLLFIIIITFIVNQDVISSLKYIWTDARYLAHSVRELLTFPLTYYPIPLYVLLKYSARTDDKMDFSGIPKVIIIFALAFIVLLTYQSIVPLIEGIGNLAQKPDFAKDGTLSIAYLLASHYFEHFLDTIFFTLSCLILIYLSKPFFTYQRNLKTETR